jgi:type IX secretion system PorP/SprF family membrane protein
MKKIFLLLILLSASEINAQDIHFSQYSESPLNVNPALAGTDNSFARACLNYRSQWSMFDKGFKTMGASFDMPFTLGSSSSLGAGLSVYQDKAGKGGLSKLYAAGTLSSVIKISELSLLSLGVQGAYNQRSVDLSGLSWGNQFNGTAYDPGITSGESDGIMSKNFFDLSAGIAFVINGNSSNLSDGDDFSMITGFSVFHLLKPNQSFQGTDRMNMRYNAFGKFSFAIPGSNMSLQPSIAYWKQGTLSEINTGMMIRYLLKPESQHTGFERGMAVSVGCHYRAKDAVYPIFLFEYADYAIGISYDINISSLTPYSQSKGGFEIMLRYRDLNGLLFGQGGKHVRFL